MILVFYFHIFHDSSKTIELIEFFSLRRRVARNVYDRWSKEILCGYEENGKGIVGEEKGDKTGIRTGQHR